MKAGGAFRVLVDGYVTGESGTGVVHSAPAFGEVSFNFLLYNFKNGHFEDVTGCSFLANLHELYMCSIKNIGYNGYSKVWKSVHHVLWHYSHLLNSRV